MASTRGEDVGVLKFVTFRLDLLLFSADGQGGRRVKKWSFCIDVTNIWPLVCNITRNQVQYRAFSKTLTSGPGATDRIRSTDGATDRIRSTDGATDHTRTTADHTAALEKKRARITA